MGIFDWLKGPKSHVKLPNRYWNSEYRFGLSYPADWKVHSENDPTPSPPWSFPLQLAGPPNPRGLRSGLSIQTALLRRDPAGLQPYAEQAIRSLRDQFRGFSLVLSDEIALLGWPAARLEYRYQRDNGSAAELNITVLIGKGNLSSAFQFVFETDASIVAQTRPLFEAVMASWHVDKIGLRHPNALSPIRECALCAGAIPDRMANTVHNLETGALIALCNACMSR